MSEQRIQNVSPKEYNGIKYRSTLEAETAKSLDALGISFTYEQRKITLLEGFKCPYQDKKVIHITYTPDFEIGSSIIIECKGFETPEWKLKKKLVYKYLMENEPGVCFYQIHNAKKQLLEALDANWTYLGFALEVKSKPSKKKPLMVKRYNSLKEAMHDLGLAGKSLGSIFKSLSGEKEFIYGYNWKLVKLTL